MLYARNSQCARYTRTLGRQIEQSTTLFYFAARTPLWLANSFKCNLRDPVPLVWGQMTTMDIRRRGLYVS